jgi:hypothetical protein
VIEFEPTLAQGIQAGVYLASDEASFVAGANLLSTGASPPSDRRPQAADGFHDVGEGVDFDSRPAHKWATRNCAFAKATGARLIIPRDEGDFLCIPVRLSTLTPIFGTFR